MAFGKKKEDIFFVMFRDFADEIMKMGEMFNDLMENYTDVERKCGGLKEYEHMCDGKKHGIMKKLNESFITPFDREDIVSIAEELDDIADYMEDVANKFLIYDVHELKEHACEMGGAIYASVIQVKKLFDGLAESKKKSDTRDAIVEINRLEDMADDMYRNAVHHLFIEEKDAIEIIRWKNILEGLEDTLDACEHLADTVEGVMMKNA